MFSIFIVFFLMLSLSTIIWIIIVPVFNFVLIPLIERRVQKKLNFTFFGFYKFYPLGMFLGKHAEIVKYITLKYLALKFKNDENYVRFSNEYAMQKINYKIENAPRYIIVVSLITSINCMIWLASLVLLAVIEIFYH